MAGSCFFLLVKKEKDPTKKKADIVAAVCNIPVALIREIGML